MTSKLLKRLGFSKRSNDVACIDEESSTSTPLKEKRDVVDIRSATYPSLPLGMLDQWTEKIIPPIVISPELWLNDTPGAKLLWAIVQENEDLFKVELSRLSTTDLMNINVDGDSLLHVVCHKKNESFLNQIMEKGVFLCSVNSIGLTPLHLSVYSNWLPGVQGLLRFGASPNILPEHICEDKGFVREEPIMTAARKGNRKIIEALLGKMNKCKSYSLSNNNIFHLGSYSQKLSTVEYLIKVKDKFTNICELNNDDESPLHTLFKTTVKKSSDEEIVRIVHLFLHNQVQINEQNNKGESALHLAAKSGLPKVVAVLVQYGANAAMKTKHNENVLHAACKSAQPEVLSILLQSRNSTELIKKPDTCGILPFHIAALNSSIDCCLLLLKYGDHLTNTDLNGITRFSYAMENMSNGESLMRQLLNGNIQLSKNESELSETITLDFSSIMSETGSKDVQDSIVSEFTNNTSEHLIVHPVVETFIYLKWRKIRPFFYVHLLMFTLFLFIHTYYIVVMYCVEKEVGVPVVMPRAIYDLHILLLTFLFILTTAYTSVDLGRYYKHYETYFNIGSLTLSTIVVFSREFGITESHMRRDVAATSVFLCWTEFMMLLGRDPSLNGTYVLMFTKIAQALIKFLVAFLALLLAFTFCFGVLFHEMPFFKYLPIAFVKILMMMIGEIEYSDFFDFLQGESMATNIIANIFLVVFTFLVTILLASLLISLAVNDLPDLHRQGNIRKLVKQASYLLSYEKIAKGFSSILTFEKFNPMRFLMRICTIRKKIVIDMHDKSPIIPMDIIKSAKQIYSDNTMAEDNRQLKYEDLLSALSQLKDTYARDLKLINEKLDKVKDIITIMSIQSRR